MKNTSQLYPDDIGLLKVETKRSGYFTFQIGLDLPALNPLISRLKDAYARFYSLPLINDIAADMEEIVLVSAIYGTNTIEGANLTEKETEEVIKQNPEQIKNEQEQRVLNLKKAYHDIDVIIPGLFKDLTSRLYLSESSFINCNEDLITQLHKDVYKNLTFPEDNIPGQYRNDDKHFPTKVGDSLHGGVYKPPSSVDVVLLMKAFTDWANSAPVKALPVLLRAPLIHYYFELIHPFRDGNGRVGRLIEAFLLQMGGYKFVSKAISHYYLKFIDKYFLLFSQCRKAAEKKFENPNTPFVTFFLEGMLDTINHLQDIANALIANVFHTWRIEKLNRDKKINDRQYLILDQLIRDENIRHKNILNAQIWYKNLYKKLGERTKLRDLKKLEELHLIFINENGQIQVVKFEPKLRLEENPLTSPHNNKLK